MPRFDAASISIRSSWRPSVIATQIEQVLQGRAGRIGIEAVDGLRQDAGGRGLAGAARPGEEVGVRHPAVAQRVAQRQGHMLLTHHLCEILGAPFAIERLRGHVILDA